MEILTLEKDQRAGWNGSSEQGVLLGPNYEPQGFKRPHEMTWGSHKLTRRPGCWLML